MSLFYNICFIIFPEKWRRTVPEKWRCVSVDCKGRRIVHIRSKKDLIIASKRHLIRCKNVNYIFAYIKLIKR